MKPNEFEIRLIKALRAIRILKCQKQVNLAKALGMTDSNYCKIEMGEKAITINQLRIAARYLETSYLQLLLIAEGELGSKFELKPLSITLLQYVLRVANTESSFVFSKEEIENLINLIRDHYNKP